MERRTKEAYKAVFQEVKRRNPRFDPSHFMNDYELAILAAVREEFSNAESDGCLYHYVAVSVNLNCISNHAKGSF